MIETRAKINSNKKLAPQYYQMSLNCPRIAKTCKPGQFIQVDIGEPGVFLRRPFSIYNIDKSNIEILYKVIGKATEALSKKKKGKALSIIGPLGNGYDISNLKTQDKAILVAGGTGIASLFFLAKSMKETKKLVLIGVKNKKELVNEKEFRKLGAEVKISSDDASIGHKGFVSDLLDKTLKKEAKNSLFIFACGPKPMLKHVAKTARKYKIPCQVSMEEHMACGVGACMGCVVKVKTKKGKFAYKRACKEGPVFDSGELIW
ncbi:MAG: dihydroorotate dehydrogenase electron transfer subunit [bacterium]